MPLPAREVALYRAAMRDVSTLAESELLTYWRQFDLSAATKVRDGLLDVLPGLVNTYFLSAASVSADWYDLMRLEAGVRKRFAAVMPDAPTDGRAEALARWSVAPLFSDSPAVDIALVKVLGGLSRTVLNGARETVVQSTRADPARVGWRRVGAGGCDYCRARIGTVVYEASVDFESHDNDHCDAVPEFD
jgi:hypothetical protein